MVKRFLVSVLLMLIAAPASAKSWRAMMAPGELAKAHAFVEEQCEKCHLVYKGVPNDRCLDCHERLRGRLEKREGFHFTVKGRACLDCHTDHHGRGASLTRESAEKAFDHAMTGFPLEGAHAKAGCPKCHDRPMDQVKPACSGCHEDPHRGALGASCAICHAGAPRASDWKAALKTKAQHRVAQTFGHEKLGCPDCHQQGRGLDPRTDCGTCHANRHGKTTASCATCHQVSGFVPAKHEHSVCTCKFPGKHITFPCLACHAGYKFAETPTLCSSCHQKTLKHEPLGECSLCHSPLSWKKKDVFDHNQLSKFKLGDRHLTVDCIRCHPVAGKFRNAALDCKGCHQALGERAHGDFGKCEACHTTVGFERSTFDHGAGTGFPLDGRHGKLSCKSCHPNVSTPASQKRTCTNCHNDPHAGMVGTNCADCHTTESFRPSTFDEKRHAATAFPLTGRHTAVRCARCHVGAQLKGLPLACGGCHVDRHAGRFGSDCARCHDTGGFEPVRGFDHATTGFALAGLHRSLACEKCHEGEIATRISRGPPFDCARCHDPGHGMELGARCDRCHAIADGARFERARGMAFPEHVETGFPLERRHVGIACKSCHPKKGPKPLPACNVCHRDPHAGQLGIACDDCHRPDRFSLARFDHDRAGWPLRGRHFVTPCSSCHTNQRWVGLNTDCWDCHARDAARAKMTVGIHPFGPLDCRDCHFSLWTWR